MRNFLICWWKRDDESVRGCGKPLTKTEADAVIDGCSAAFPGLEHWAVFCPTPESAQETRDRFLNEKPQTIRERMESHG
jgi:hypothetical protein